MVLVLSAARQFAKTFGGPVIVHHKPGDEPGDS
jgi:hypothetical protein